MKITASQAVKTTAKLNKVGKQLSLIGSKLISGKYANAEDLRRVRASVVNASNIARRANDQILDSISSSDELRDIISCGNADVMDKVIESTLEVATRAAMLCKAIDGELENIEPAEEVVEDEEITDEILDDEGADVDTEASEEVVEVTDDIGEDAKDDIVACGDKDSKVACGDKGKEDIEVKASEDEEPETADEIDDTVEDDEAVEVEAGEDVAEGDEDTEEVVEEVEAPIVAKKKAAAATKKASVVKKTASVRGGAISWTMPSLPEAKRR